MFVLLTALLSRKFVSFVANHVDTKLFGGKARSRFRDLVVELEAEQKARRVRKELGGNPFAGHAMAARTEDGRRRSGRNRAAPARYGVESTTTSEESESDGGSSDSDGEETKILNQLKKLIRNILTELLIKNKRKVLEKIYPFNSLIYYLTKLSIKL